MDEATYYFHKKSRRLQMSGTRMMNNQKFALPQRRGTMPLYSGKTPLEMAGPMYATTGKKMYQAAMEPTIAMTVYLVQILQMVLDG